MHVLGIKREIAEEHPWSRSTCSARSTSEEPRHEAHGESADRAARVLSRSVEEQEELMGLDPWEYGLTDRNRHTLETISTYAHEQGLTRRKLPLDQLFIDMSQGRKRGVEFRI